VIDTVGERTEIEGLEALRSNCGQTNIIFKNGSLLPSIVVVKLLQPLYPCVSPHISRCTGRSALSPFRKTKER